MKMIKLHYVKDNKEVVINTDYIISYEQYIQNGLPAYTEITALTDQCFDVKETPHEIDQLIGIYNSAGYDYVTTISNIAPNSNVENGNGKFLKSTRWSNKKKNYRGRGRKREIGL